MDIQESICSGQAEVTMSPLNRGGGNYQVVLEINGEYYGEFNTYADAASHLQALANS